jgi:hypothetical protein
VRARRTNNRGGKEERRHREWDRKLELLKCSRQIDATDGDYQTGSNSTAGHDKDKNNVSDVTAMFVRSDGSPKVAPT